MTDVYMIFIEKNVCFLLTNPIKIVNSIHKT